MYKRGLITKSLRDAAHEIRYFGNFGAHPQKDDLDNVTYEDAKTIWNLTSSFLMDLYIRPSRIKNLTDKRQNKN